MKAWIISAFALAVVPVAEARAQAADFFGDYRTAAGLAVDCEARPALASLYRTPSVEQMAAAGRCEAYFNGFVAANQIREVLDAAVGRASLAFCWPPTLARHPAESLLAYLERHPDKGGDPAGVVVMNAMVEEYGEPPANGRCRDR